MNVQITPELAKFIDEQVNAGRFASPDEAVNAAVERMRDQEVLVAGEIREEDLQAIERGLAQLNRGEGLPVEQVRRKFRGF